MQLVLMPHPDTPCPSVRRLEVDIIRSRSGLRLGYAIRGDVGALRIPDQVKPTRRDGLWQHTCFEVFIRSHADSAYLEINLSPSTEWAAYAFDRYRTGMAPLPQVPEPEIGIFEDEGIHELRATIDLNEVVEFDRDLPWRIGLSAVIEDARGAKSYWALAHPPGAPDFHHEDCFALELPPAKQS